MKLSAVLLVFGMIAIVVSCISVLGKRVKTTPTSTGVLYGGMGSGDSIEFAEIPYIDNDLTVPIDNTHIDTTIVGASGANHAYRSPASYVIEDVTGVDHVVRDETKPDSTKGIVAYNIPDDMTVGRYYEVKVRITKDIKGKQQLVVGEEGNQPIASAGEKSTITIESIRVESVMSAELTSSDKAFEITSTSTKEQNIEKFGYTEWAWNIKPIKSGEHPLKLVIKVRVLTEHGGFYKDIVVFNRNIKAKASLSYSLSIWFGSYWQWLCTTIIIPIFLWWRKRKKESDISK